MKPRQAKRQSCNPTENDQRRARYSELLSPYLVVWLYIELNLQIVVFRLIATSAFPASKHVRTQRLRTSLPVSVCMIQWAVRTCRQTSMEALLNTDLDLDLHLVYIVLYRVSSLGIGPESSLARLVATTTLQLERNRAPPTTYSPRTAGLSSQPPRCNVDITATKYLSVSKYARPV